MKKFFVRAYRPYIVDYVWELWAPGANQKDAMSKVADVMRDETKEMPTEWITKSGYDEDGAEMPCLHGHTGWEVLDKDSSDRTSIKPDTSGQRAFVWSYQSNYIVPRLQIKPANLPCIPTIGHDRFGMLIAERCVAEDPAWKETGVNTIDPKDLEGGVTGQLFWVPKESAFYRVIWAFANPQ